MNIKNLAKGGTELDKKIRKYTKSFIFKLTIVISLTMVILLCVLIISYSYSLYVVKKNSVDSSQNAMRIYINNMDNRFKSATRDLEEIIAGDDILDISSSNESISYFSLMRLKNTMFAKVSVNKNADALIVCNQQDKNVLSVYGSSITADEKMNLDSYAKNTLLDKKVHFSKTWKPMVINHRYYFSKMYYFFDTIVTALIKADTLMSFVDETAAKTQEKYVLTDYQGKLIVKAGYSGFSDIRYPLKNHKKVVEGLNNRYMMITTALGESDVRLSEIVKEKTIFQGLDFIQWVIAILCIIAFIILVIMVYFLNKEVIRPINRLIKATRKIESGDLEYKVNTAGSSREFEALYNSFNSMTKEIKTLKIQSYEEKIQLQKFELKYLQMQLKPHFFLNAITTIHSLSIKNKNEEIRTFINALSRHLRYMFKKGLNKVLLMEEVEHVKNYIAMQEIKFPNSVFYVFDMEKGLEEAQIPQLLIQTFVENSFKHAMTLEETLSIFIKIKILELDENDFIQIVIEDSGEGFPIEVLQRVNNEALNDIMDGYGIGISNIKRILSLMYSKENLLKISNAQPSGGRVEILIPM